MSSQCCELGVGIVIIVFQLCKCVGIKLDMCRRRTRVPTLTLRGIHPVKGCPRSQKKTAAKCCFECPPKLALASGEKQTAQSF